MRKKKAEADQEVTEAQHARRGEAISSLVDCTEANLWY
jgi:hypothetical protein